MLRAGIAGGEPPGRAPGRSKHDSVPRRHPLRHAAVGGLRPPHAARPASASWHCRCDGRPAAMHLHTAAVREARGGLLRAPGSTELPRTSSLRRSRKFRGRYLSTHASPPSSLPARRRSCPQRLAQGDGRNTACPVDAPSSRRWGGSDLDVEDRPLAAGVARRTASGGRGWIAPPAPHRTRALHLCALHACMQHQAGAQLWHGCPPRWTCVPPYVTPGPEPP